MCWDFSFRLGQNTIFAIHCSTCCEGDSIAAQVLESEFWQRTHICKQVIRELIPSSTWFVCIFLTYFHLYMVYAIYWFFNRCINCSCAHNQCLFCQHAQVDVINWLSSHEAVVNHFIYTCIWIYRYDCRNGQLSRAVNRYHCSHPYDCVGWVGEGQFDVFARIFDFGNIHIIPLNLIRSQSSTLVPVERNQILAQTWVGALVLHIQTKAKCLIRSNFQIHLLCIYFAVQLLETLQFVEKTTYEVWSH